MRMSQKLEDAAKTIAVAYVADGIGDSEMRGRIAGLVIAVFICDGVDYSPVTIEENVENLIRGVRHGIETGIS